MRLFIAEKPSMGKAIAAELPGKATTTRTHVEVGNDVVTWCFGHLLELSPPQAYDAKYEKWTFEDLPIIPSQWKMQISGDKKDQVKAIKDLIKNADEIIHAGDPGREGQLIVDELLAFVGNKKPVRRILLNALDSKTIQSALNHLEPNQKFSPLFLAGQARSHADWLMGMNLTRAYSVLGRRAGVSTGGALSVGRVQTPTLGIVVNRDLEIENFKPKDFWTLAAKFEVAEGSFLAKWQAQKPYEPSKGLDEEGRLVVQNQATTLVQKVKDKTGVVTHFEEKPKTIEPPLPFSLSLIQTFANSKWGVTASDTLKICQELYETKLTSYPRTDCTYLPENQWGESKEVLDAVKNNLPVMASVVSGSNSQLKSRAWNDKKLSEHHALIPTRSSDPNALMKLSPMHQNFYKAIAQRYLAQFYPNCEAFVTKVDVVVEEEHFHATGQRIVSPGWKQAFGNELENQKEAGENQEDEEGETAVFPKIQEGESAQCKDPKITASKTTPPPRFNDGSLIAAMTNIHTLVTDPELKKKLKDVKGLGTEATRSNILEVLVSRQFLKRDKKALVSTPVGRALIFSFPPRMIDPALTALWENAFEAIAQAENTTTAQSRYQIFIDKQSAWLKQILSIAHQADFSKFPKEEKKNIQEAKGHGETCPKCNEGKMLTREIKKGASKGKTFLGCSNYPKCTHSIWP